MVKDRLPLAAMHRIISARANRKVNKPSVVNVNRSVMRLIGLAVFLIGLLVSVVGYGLYRSPKLDWAEFAETCFVLVQGTAAEVGRLVEDPIAFVGLVTLLGGLVLAYNGLKEFIFGKQKTFSEIWTGKEHSAIDKQI